MRNAVGMHLLERYCSLRLGAGWIGSPVFLDVPTWSIASILPFSGATKRGRGSGLWLKYHRFLLFLLRFSKNVFLCCIPLG